MVDEPFEHAGYLADEARRGEEAVTANFPDTFRWLFNANRTAMAMLHAIDDPAVIPSDQDRIIVGILFVIAIRRFQASVLLLRRFMVAEGESVCRAGLEAVFLLGAFTKDRQNVLALLEADREASSRAGINAVLASRNQFELTPEQVARLSEALTNLPAERTRIKWDQLARAADMLPLYNVAYRSASLNSAHVTERTMARHFNGNSQEGQVAFDANDSTLVPSAQAALKMLHVATLTIAQHYDMRNYADRVREIGASAELPLDGHLSTDASS